MVAQALLSHQKHLLEAQPQPLRHVASRHAPQQKTGEAFYQSARPIEWPRYALGNRSQGKINDKSEKFLKKMREKRGA